MTVNGVNSANNAAYAQAVQSLLQQGKPVNETTIAEEMNRLRKANPNMGLEVEQTGGIDDKSKELTDGEKQLKEHVLTEILAKQVKSLADLNGLIVELGDYRNVLNDADVQAALKAKKADLTPKPKQPDFDAQAALANLDKTDVSGETIELQIAAEKTKQAILDFVPHIEIDKAKDIKANHGAVVQQFIDVAVTGNKPKSNNAESLKNIAQTKLTADQKTQLQSDLEAIAAMDLQAICSEFGITINTENLANLGEEATPEQVAEQLKYVNDLLAQIEGSVDKEGKPTGLLKVKADRAAADQNIANNNKTIAKYEQMYADMVANGEIEEGAGDPNLEQVTKLQNANVTALKVVAKADAVMASIDPLHKHLLKIQQQLNKATTDLKNIADFDTEAEKIKNFQIKYEDDVLVKEKEDVDKATKKRDEASEAMTSAKFDNDKDLNALEGSDKKANAKTDKKYVKYQKAQSVLSQEIQDRNVIQQVIDERTEKQAELEELRGKEVEKQAP